MPDPHAANTVQPVFSRLRGRSPGSLGPAGAKAAFPFSRRISSTFPQHPIATLSERPFPPGLTAQSGGTMDADATHATPG